MSDLFDGLYVFEMANNHQGSVEHGLRIIEAAGRIARRHRVKAAVKLQFRDLDSFIHPDFKGRQDVKHIPRFESTRMDVADFRRFVDATHEAGLISMATPFDEASVGTCLQLGVQIVKVASCSAADWPLLTAVAEARRPVIASTGGLQIYDIDALVSFLSKRVPSLGLMHCVSVYPTPQEEVAMGFMGKMIRRYPYVTVGYSGHEPPADTEVPQVAVAVGAKILERHIGVPTDTIKLNAYSMNPDEADAWVAAGERARRILGDGTKHVTEVEADSLRELQRGVFAKRVIAKGETIRPEDVFFAMPRAEGQLTSGAFGQLRAHYVASKDYAEREAIHESAQSDEARQVRGILHDAKGMLYEAGLVVGDDCTVEISHHFGLERFRQTGCILVNVVNRDYCNKLLIVMPGQSHPDHYHKQKEETFHLLWGDLRLVNNGKVHDMKPGDKVLVERGDVHNFSSVGGAIFHEISTRSIVGDSYYTDPAIAALDPMQRKTILDRF